MHLSSTAVVSLPPRENPDIPWLLGVPHFPLCSGKPPVLYTPRGRPVRSWLLCGTWGEGGASVQGGRRGPPTPAGLRDPLVAVVVTVAVGRTASSGGSGEEGTAPLL